MPIVVRYSPGQPDTVWVGGKTLREAQFDDLRKAVRDLDPGELRETISSEIARRKFSGNSSNFFPEMFL